MSNFYLNITLFTLEYADVFASIHAKFMFLGTVIIDVIVLKFLNASFWLAVFLRQHGFVIRIASL